MSHDSRLQQSVIAELRWEPSVDAAHIGVAAKDGVVTLSGHVGSFAEKHAAEAAATRVKGVRGVAEEIEVKLPFDTRRGDDEIAAAAIDSLSWDVTVPKDKIKVKVEKGWVTLSGEVDWKYEKDAAAQDVRRLLGVVGVSNQVTIRPGVDVSNLTDDILHALHRSWFFDPKTIAVTAEHGRVRLAGTVRTPHERQVAAATAWAAPGVVDVQNDLVVADE